jgi:molecular chaperone GrpE (heat shock protein)
MPADDRVSTVESVQEAANVARHQARALLRALSEERKRAAAGSTKSRSDLKAVVLAAVEGIEGLAGIALASADTLPAEAARTLATAVQAAWERLELAGVVRDGAAGETLDLARHKVVKRRAALGVAAGQVVQVLSPGLVFGSERLRDAAVVVSK